MSEEIQAFILGAGLGARLRPLTEERPKPLVPVNNRPLITYALDHLVEELGVGSFLVNTHHRPERYPETFPEGDYRGRSIGFRHEPVLLDTAGGIDNVRDWLPTDRSFVVYNGDILTDLPLRDAWDTHLRRGDVVTLVLRSGGDERRVGYDADAGWVVDLRGALRPEWEDRRQFTGIYFVSPAFLRFIRPGVIESVVSCFLEAIRAGERVGGVVVDEGEWSDLGDRETYLDALTLPARGFPAWGSEGVGERIAASASVDESARVDALSCLGDSAVVGAEARIEESILWAGARVEPGATLRRVVVRNGGAARGDLADVDV